jgi:hypothetical protein
MLTTEVHLNLLRAIGILQEIPSDATMTRTTAGTCEINSNYTFICTFAEKGVYMKSSFLYPQ